MARSLPGFLAKYASSMGVPSGSQRAAFHNGPMMNCLLLRDGLIYLAVRETRYRCGRCNNFKPERSYDIVLRSVDTPFGRNARRKRVLSFQPIRGKEGRGRKLLLTAKGCESTDTNRIISRVANTYEISCDSR